MNLHQQFSASIPLSPYLQQQRCFLMCKCNVSILFIALRYNDLFLLTEVSGPRSVHCVRKKSQMMRQTPPFMGTRT